MRLLQLCAARYRHLIVQGSCICLPKGTADRESGLMAGETVDGRLDPTANPDMNPIFAGVCPPSAGSRQRSVPILGFGTYRLENRPANPQNTAFSLRFPSKTLNSTDVSPTLDEKTPVLRPQRYPPGAPPP
jgi:hypothetical protein